MKQIGIWQVTDTGPRQATASSIDLECHLEEWIERDPALLENGLTIVGRRLAVEAGQLDLLALDPQSRWVIIELKRGVIYREALAQALDYTACIAAMPHEELHGRVNEYLRRRQPVRPADLEATQQGRDALADPREVRVYLVGTGRDPSLDRVVDLLSGTYGVPISVVSYEVYELADGQRVLVRELTESETTQGEVIKQALPTPDELCARADAAGIGPRFRAIFQAATHNGLYARPFKRSLMLASPSNRTRSLFTVWAEATTAGNVDIWLGPEVFAQFYPMAKDEVTAELGAGGYRSLTEGDVDAFVAGLNRLFAKIGEAQQDQLDGVPRHAPGNLEADGS